MNDKRDSVSACCRKGQKGHCYRTKSMGCAEGLDKVIDTLADDDARLWSARWLFNERWITYDDLIRVKEALAIERQRDDAAGVPETKTSDGDTK